MMKIEQTFKKLLLASLIASLAACGGDDGTDGATGPQGEQGPQGETGAEGPAGEDATNSTISLQFAGRYETGAFDESASEIVVYDPATNQIFSINANSGMVDVLNIAAPSMPVLTMSLDIASDVAGAIDGLASADELGAANSVAVHDGVVAVAVEADTKQSNGYVAFYQNDGIFLAAVEVGALPDMLTFTPDGSMVLVANEGEPNGDYSVDPEGSVSVINVSGGAATVTQADVSTLDFTDFNAGGSRAGELGSDVRVSSKSASVAQDLEPEYITVSPDSASAWVALQENNAIAKLDLATMEVSAILGLGYKDYSILGNELDASNKDDSINIRNWPVRGLFMPDTIDSFEFAGVNYLITANEGDGREYLTDEDDATACTAAGGFDFDDGDCFHYLDEIRAKDIQDTGATIDLPSLGFYAESVEELTEDENLGRIKVVADMGVSDCTGNTLATTGQPGAGCVYKALYSYGARSFSIWNGETGELVYDSGSDFERITAQRLGGDFNATNDENGGDDRSDDKGPEPEAVEVAHIAGATYAFIGLERVGGIMVYNISNPEAAQFVQYINTRDFSVDIEALVDAGDFSAAGDLGPESVLFIAAEDSPSGEPLLVVGNEVSGTIAMFNVNVVDSAP
ncbi:choice-of-anchor I family protein [Gilvimarinus sp. SDUM040013]|uniref:Choice-of-anchor I family protein n=1 Tax=Gilvimarinus gilvus TaxID=3058038 RepID=A0ABU4S0E0_9GAMM|nr:choice-of-anchor I family protein [Gilvimarinus sp. SDUM040013]MDO3387920.1 choice-of-anchor I family protein [Gilvimarinus sp. SDUM040013]MDX6848709.1 choice-of-anchor I family protein [Gilvimarinus sp. SDUM040013]